jgi:hypothetical protein
MTFHPCPVTRQPRQKKTFGLDTTGAMRVSVVSEGPVDIARTRSSLYDTGGSGPNQKEGRVGLCRYSVSYAMHFLKAP